MTSQNPPSTTSRSLDAEARRSLAEELDATEEQIDEAVAAVGPSRSDIEMHLKGTRSSTNADRMKDAGV